MRLDELHSTLDPVVEETSRRPAPPRLRAWLGPASLVVLFIATSWAVGAYASPWLIVPYWIVMAVLVGLPSSEAPAKSKSKPSVRKNQQHPSRTIEVPPRPRLADREPSALAEDSEKPDWEPEREREQERESESVSDASTPKAKKPKGRPRKAKAVAPAAVVVEPPPAVWVQVGPGKFVRADMLHPPASEGSEPAVAAVSTEASDPFDHEVPEVTSLGFEEAPNSPEPEQGVAARLGEVFNIAPVPFEEAARDSVDVNLDDVSSSRDLIDDLPAKAVNLEDTRDQGNAPEALESVEASEPLDVANLHSSAMEPVEDFTEPPALPDPESGRVEDFRLEDAGRLEASAQEEAFENSEAEEAWNLEKRESDYQDDDDIAPVRKQPRPHFQGAGSSRGNGRRRGLVEAGLSGGGDRSNRKSPGTSRANRRSGRWAALGRASRAGRSHPPRSPPRRGRVGAFASKPRRS